MTLNLIEHGFIDIRRTVAPTARYEPDCVDGLPLNFTHQLALHEECEFDDAYDDHLLPAHEVDRHRRNAHGA